MRTIKFRGKDIETGEWIYGNLYQGTREGKQYSIILNDAGYHVAPQDDRSLAIAFAENEVNVVFTQTVGQFIGLLDKNGIGIYEGDIVRVKQIGGYGMQYIGVVRYYDKDCRFGIDTTKTCLFTNKRELFTDGECSDQDGHCTRVYTNTYEVIGNIHDMTWIKIDRDENGFATEEHLRKIEECYANNNTVVIAYENYLQHYDVITPCSRIDAWLAIIKREKVYTHYMVLPKAIKARRKKE